MGYPLSTMLYRNGLDQSGTVVLSVVHFGTFIMSLYIKTQWEPPGSIKGCPFGVL